MTPRRPRQVTQPLYVHGLFCESVRMEVQGAQTLVGILPGRVAIPDVPGTFSALWSVAWITWPLARKAPSVLQSELVLPDDQRISMPEQPFPAMPEQPADGSTIGQVTIVQSYANIPIARFGRLLLFVTVDGRRYRAAGLRIVPSEPTPMVAPAAPPEPA